MYTMRPAEFDYHRPASVDEAVALLGDLGDAKALAGGHSLLPAMKLRLSTPAAIVDLGGIPGLDGIAQDGDRLVIGSLATHASVAASDLVRAECPVLAEAAGEIGDRQVRNRGTIGGSVAHADPGADYPTVLKALGATIATASKSGGREIAADDFFVGVFATALEPGELITSVAVPVTAKGTGAAYLKHRHPASGYAVVGVGAVVTVAEGRCTAVQLTIGGVAETPVNADAAAKALTGQAPSDEAIAAAAEQVSAPGQIADGYASGEYRVELARVLARRALAAAVERVR
jgi:carbon-monoxide dehydrogenase medium subunit